MPGNTYPLTSRLTDAFVQEGAKLSMNVRDVMEEFNLSWVAASQQHLRGLHNADVGKESTLLRWLGTESVYVDGLSREGKFHFNTVTWVLALIELKGLAKPGGTMNYIYTREATA